ncbi:MAG: prohibitin family protein [Phycisphaerae bacterium]|nr:prohibitin family protein [Phycisphaerae bacterium]MDW8262084.1 prohibitin family protein [Phycisphaerales bacterium]
MDQKKAPPAIIGFIVLVVVLVILFGGCFYVVEPGTRGVKVTLGRVSEQFLPEGFGFKAPLITQVHPVQVRQISAETPAECYSSDLQQVNMTLKILYSIPESSVVDIYRKYAGDPFESLVAPRIQEAIKEATALNTAEQIVKQREAIKLKAFEAAKKKIGGVLNIHDLVIVNITLTKELEAAIEAKMVQEQEASKARFTQEKARIEAETKAIQAEIEAKATITRAKAEAESIKIRGDALKQNPDLIGLQIVEKWDGRAPMVIGGGAGGSPSTIILPIEPRSTR